MLRAGVQFRWPYQAKAGDCRMTTTAARLNQVVAVPLLQVTALTNIPRLMGKSFVIFFLSLAMARVMNFTAATTFEYATEQIQHSDGV